MHNAPPRDPSDKRGPFSTTRSALVRVLWFMCIGPRSMVHVACAVSGRPRSVPLSRPSSRPHEERVIILKFSVIRRKSTTSASRKTKFHPSVANALSFRTIRFLPSAVAAVVLALRLRASHGADSEFGRASSEPDGVGRRRTTPRRQSVPGPRRRELRGDEAGHEEEGPEGYDLYLGLAKPDSKNGRLHRRADPRNHRR
ncbi:hypothetical protein ACHAWF_000929 [Thalassiosira exigua]